MREFLQPTQPVYFESLTESFYSLCGVIELVSVTKKTCWLEISDFWYEFQFASTEFRLERDYLSVKEKGTLRPLRPDVKVV